MTEAIREQALVVAQYLGLPGKWNEGFGGQVRSASYSLRVDENELDFGGRLSVRIPIDDNLIVVCDYDLSLSVTQSTRLWSSTVKWHSNALHSDRCHAALRFLPSPDAAKLATAFAATRQLKGYHSDTPDPVVTMVGVEKTTFDLSVDRLLWDLLKEQIQTTTAAQLSYDNSSLTFEF